MSAISPLLVAGDAAEQFKINCKSSLFPFHRPNKGGTFSVAVFLHRRVVFFCVIGSLCLCRPYYKQRIIRGCSGSHFCHPLKLVFLSTSGLIFVNRTHFSPLCIGPDSLSTALYRSAFSPPHQKMVAMRYSQPRLCRNHLPGATEERRQIDGSNGVIGP